MLNKLKYLVIGSPLPNEVQGEKRLNKIRALAAFSPDALSSIAYANQEIYLGLLIAGSAGLSLQFPIAMAIAFLLGIVALSYAQTIRGYPLGGGSYTVARNNLGVTGTFLSNVGLAVTNFAGQKKVLFLAAEPLTDKITWEDGNKYTFRLRASTYMQVAMLMPDT